MIEATAAEEKITRAATLSTEVRNLSEAYPLQSSSAKNLLKTT